MNPKMKIILLFAMPYSIKDDATGRVTEGITINYYLGSDLSSKSNLDNGSIGLRPAKCSIPIDKKNQLVTAPAFYEAEFEMTIGSDGKPVLKITNLDYVNDCVLVESKPQK